MRHLPVVLSLAVALLLSVLFATWVGAYQPDFIDKERYENWKAMRSGDCFWYPRECRGYTRSSESVYNRRRWPSREYVYRGRQRIQVTTISPKCKAPVRVVGWEANTRGGALVYGERAWFFSVRHDHGAKYANLDRARDVKLICDPSTITQVAKRVLWICVVSAIPCEGPMLDNDRSEKRFDRDDVELRD